VPRFAIAPLGLTTEVAPNLNQKGENATLKNYSVVDILVTVQDRPMLSHINGKLSLRPFKITCWTLVYLEI